jgi:hypothetical protein
MQMYPAQVSIHMTLVPSEAMSMLVINPPDPIASGFHIVPYCSAAS